MERRFCALLPAFLFLLGRNLELHADHGLIGLNRLVAHRQRQFECHARLLRGNHGLMHVDAGTGHQPGHRGVGLVFELTDLGDGVGEQVGKGRRRLARIRTASEPRPESAGLEKEGVEVAGVEKAGAMAVIGLIPDCMGLLYGCRCCDEVRFS